MFRIKRDNVAQSVSEHLPVLYERFFMEFELHVEGIPIYAENYLAGSLSEPWEPIIGNTVSLKSGEVSVIAKILTSDNREYSGQIIDFQNHNGSVYKSKKLGDVITFIYSNIISYRH